MAIKKAKKRPVRTFYGFAMEGKKTGQVFFIATSHQIDAEDLMWALGEYDCSEFVISAAKLESVDFSDPRTCKYLKKAEESESQPQTQFRRAYTSECNKIWDRLRKRLEKMRIRTVGQYVDIMINNMMLGQNIYKRDAAARRAGQRLGYANSEALLSVLFEQKVVRKRRRRTVS